MRYAGADTQVVHSVVANRLVGDRKKGYPHEKRANGKKKDKTDLPFGQVRMPISTAEDIKFCVAEKPGCGGD